MIARVTEGIQVTRGKTQRKGAKTLAATSRTCENGVMGTAVAERTRKYLDTGDVASILERSRKWVRDRYDRGVFFGYRDADDDIRKITVASLRAYMVQHGIDTADLDEYLEAHP